MTCYKPNKGTGYKWLVKLELVEDAFKTCKEGYNDY
ncbi:Uncharacterised protein [Mycobacterium tuberculosis]|nr:Uncharacterised protein [Mycobacterium tuberculosis]